MSLCGLHRRLRGALVGQFATVELTSSPGADRLVRAMRRLRCAPAAIEFYAEHVEADAAHEQLVRCGVIAPLLAAEPELAGDVVVGIWASTLLSALHPFLETVMQSPLRGAELVIADFMTGDPQEPPPPGFVEALQRCSVPTSTDWFVFLTRGADGAIALALSTVVDPGDEVVFLGPPWFFYKAMIIASGATLIRVRLEPPAFDLEVDAHHRGAGTTDPSHHPQQPA
jgi:hypothetical protein